MNPDKWLGNLLKRYGLNQPDGRMLYGYRLTDDEYLSLKDTLAFASEFGQLGEVARKIRSFPALFVLYAAEWWRREYQGGAWEWAPIIGSFGGDATQLATNARTECVQQGFAYWGHRPSGEGKKFFGAAVAQGGLPLKFIGNGGGKLASIMASALRSATRFHWDESQIAQDVADRADELPGSLHKPEIYALIAQMVRAVLELKKEFQLTGETDPIAILNKRDPQWRERFPLQLEDVAAEALLTGLVKEAAQQVVVSSSSMFAVERFLKPIAEGRYELMSSLHCPTTVHVENLVHLFRLHTNEDLPRYFSIDAQVGEREPFADGRQILGAETAKASLFVNKRYL
ncbi:hypothetical protein CAP31_08795 [Sulfuriferula sp. AH1]|uniref:STY4851/ECs_5259 family protein n=1 Tax=Sulfuriferula sp. AH1 TaxID=1985873 RepID=UPI000B3B128F|nr:STY4851/ECs_5259 family protein [Sulfuriferula sp. AH1]ARU31768.1 hypothetical protein CAP31_08795 [Sulfuriferula sp. AH1]